MFEDSSVQALAMFCLVDNVLFQLVEVSAVDLVFKHEWKSIGGCNEIVVVHVKTKPFIVSFIFVVEVEDEGICDGSAAFQ